jgi:hypothetical protein
MIPMAIQLPVRLGGLHKIHLRRKAHHQVEYDVTGLCKADGLNPSSCEPLVCLQPCAWRVFQRLDGNDSCTVWIQAYLA